MKKMLAVLLALLLSATTLTPAMAVEDSAVQDRPPSDIGEVRVSIASALVMEKDVTFDVSLNAKDGGDASKASASGSKPFGGKSEKITLGPDSSSKPVLFDHVPDGRYILSVSAPLFSKYEQEIEVEQSGVDVNLATGILGGIDYSTGNHPGVLRIGDVKKDGIIDAGDLEAMIDASEKQRKSAADSATGNASFTETDLTGDGVTDIADLEYLSIWYQGDAFQEEACKATLGHFVSTSILSGSTDEGTKVATDGGSVEAMLRQEGSVKLERSDGNPISEEHPVSLTIDLADGCSDEASTTDGILIETGENTTITQAEIDITYADEGKGEQTVKTSVKQGAKMLTESDVYAEIDSSGNIQVHLGGQVAVKKVKLSISGVEGNGGSATLAEISKVEFVNGMESRIPEPEMNIPKNVRTQAGSEMFYVSWDGEVNITGYEAVVWMDGNPDKTATFQLAHNSLEVTALPGIGDGKVKNLTTYWVKVRSVNGSWHSDFCDAVSVTPRPQGPPDKPDNVVARGMFQSISVTWKKMDDTESYNVSYRVKGRESQYTTVNGIKNNSYQILGLEDLTTYEIYVQGVNDLGTSSPSLLAEATTTDMKPANMPKYKVVNYPGEPGSVSEHIKSASHSGNAKGKDGTTTREMRNSPLDDDSAKSALGTVDNDQHSYYYSKGWNDGGAYAGGGLSFTFDREYELDAFAFTNARAVDNVSADPYFVRVKYDGCPEADGIEATLSKRADADGRAYFLVQLPHKVATRTLSFGLSIYPQYGDCITVSEVYFYQHDPLWDDIMALYEDDLHTVLRQGVKKETIDELKGRLEETDPASGEKHYDYVQLAKELRNAEDILNAESLSPSVVVHNDIVMEPGVDRGFSGINDWQPLGVTAAKGEQITVYVGHSTRKTGQSAQLELVFTQYHAESNALAKTCKLNVGANSITVPDVATFADQESGGAMYVRYTGNRDSEGRYAVRVNGGAQSPRLDLHGVEDHAKRLEAARAYLAELKAHSDAMQESHESLHKGEGAASSVKLDYDERNCILGATDILLDTMMYSIPAKQVLSGSGGNAETLVRSLDAAEDMMNLFYQHKGLSNNAADQVDKIPAGHLNIRYMRMFSGAFMYASGNHIGVEYDQTSGLASCGGVESDGDGKYVGGSYFGWGIAHEIGHNINQGSYSVAEITNNYFAQLSQAQDKNEGMRWQDYQKVYDKVTSGEKGDCQNIAVQLAMYWQLHLAYDPGYNYKTYENYDKQLENLFYARVDTYARTPSKAPKAKTGGIELNLSGADKDQALMRLSCAAAEKNILAFFERWGKTPNEETLAYASQFPAETRAICYANDDSRIYSLSGNKSRLSEDGTTEAVTEASVNVKPEAGNKVDIKLKSSLPEKDLLGFEIVRVMYAPDDDVATSIEQRTPVGFTTTDTFTDTVLTVNNRAVRYEITAIDQHLNRSKAKVTDAVKIAHDGELYQTNWTLSANAMKADTSDAAKGYLDEDVKDAAQEENVFLRAIDDDAETYLTLTMDREYDEGMAAVENGFNAGLGPYLELDFGDFETVSGFSFTPASIDGATKGMPRGYAVYLVTADNGWVGVAKGSFAESGVQTVYFENADKQYVSTYKARGLIFMPTGVSGGESFSVAELDVLGVTGDNIDFRTTGDTGKTLIGKLSSDYVYGDQANEKIPAGSLVFMGAYKGNAAYNVVALYDENGKLVVGSDKESDQVILADVPDGGSIQDVKDGTWIYWIEPGKWSEDSLPSSVRAELYRVNNAKTNEGQRLVSDTLFEKVPSKAELPSIELGK